MAVATGTSLSFPSIARGYHAHYRNIVYVVNGEQEKDIISVIIIVMSEPV